MVGLGLGLGTVEHHTLTKMPSVMAFKSYGGLGRRGRGHAKESTCTLSTVNG